MQCISNAFHEWSEHEDYGKGESTTRQQGMEAEGHSAIWKPLEVGTIRLNTDDGVCTSLLYKKDGNRSKSSLLLVQT
ncbi:hypothetical protein ACH5RR_033853 [Cinchona calisaya]|uniref:Uncharacterized protein n=1 Tax=Cinchona calisaya TaxID=153742 RepID=A0ABD2Y967_9GENT